MRDTKWQLPFFSFYDRTDMESHVEWMAAQGWELERIGNFGWHYRRREPKALHVTVTYFPRATVFDPAPSEEEQIFRDFCAQAGWRLLASSAQLQVYGNEQDNPVPIETDAALQVTNVHEAMKRSHLRSTSALLLLGIFNFVLFFMRLYNDPLTVLSSSTNLLVGFCWVMQIGLGLVEITGYFRWYRKARAAAELDGSFVETNGRHYVRMTGLLLLLMIFVFVLFSENASSDNLNLNLSLLAIFSLLIILLFMATLMAIRDLLKRKMVSATINRAIMIFAAVALSLVMVSGMAFYIIHGISSGALGGRTPVETYEHDGMTWGIYHDELPLLIEDIVEVAHEGYSYERRTNDSPFLTHIDASQRPKLGAKDIPFMEYTITKVKVASLYSMCRQELLQRYTTEFYRDMGYHWREQDGAGWNANQVYLLYSQDTSRNRYVICWTDRIVELSPSWELTPAQITVIAEKLIDA